MENIINNLTNISWWFSGLFFVIIAYILPKIIKFVLNIPLYTKKFKRKNKLKRLIKIKKIRFDDTKIIIESIKNSSWLVIFTLSIIIYFFTYLTQPYLNKINIFYLIFSFLPIYIIEIIYLIQNTLFKELLIYRDKLKTNKL